MYSIDYERPTTIDAAVALQRNAPEAKFIAGGMTLLPTMKLRLADPGLLVDLGGIRELEGVRYEHGKIRIGAMCRHVDVANDPIVAQYLPALGRLAAGIGDAQVRHRGTIGGSVANNDPAADYPAAVLALDASIITNVREISAAEFFLGLFDTALREDEIICALRFRPCARAGYAKYRSPASRYALLGAFVARLDENVRVAITGAGGGVFRVPAIEKLLAQSFSPRALDNYAHSAEDFDDDIYTSARYRAHLVKIMAARAVVQAQG